MEALKSQIVELARNADDVTRKQLVTDLRNLSISIEGNDDSLQRLANTPLQLYGAWIGQRLKIFELLSQSDAAVSLDALAKSTKSDPVLLGRLLRFMSSVKLVDETAHDSFAPNNVTKVLASPRGQNHIELYYNIVNPILNGLPAFLEKTSFQNPYDESKTAFSDVYGFPGPIYEWWAANPDKSAIFNKHMEFRREGGASWLDEFPVKQYGGSCEADDVLFVDVGGNIGHECERLRKAYPNLNGRVILQDLSYAIEKAPTIPNVEKMIHDLFEPQPVKGARMYYLRGVLHCFPDEKCIPILRNILMAMGPQSHILIDEAVLSDSDVFWQATQQDMLMMAAMASVERTRSQWEKLLAAAGMKIAHVHVYSPTVYESVIVAVPA